MKVKHFEEAGQHVIATVDSAMKMNIKRIHLAQGESYAIKVGMETAVLLLQGQLRCDYEATSVQFERVSVFEEEASCLHVNQNVEVQLHALSACECIIQQVYNPTAFATVVYYPKDIKIDTFGEGSLNNTSLRTVKVVFDYHRAPYANMVLGEVISHAGNWSSYPPHHHPQPEVYLYKYEREEGFGVSFINEEAYFVKNNSVSYIEGGHTHPQATAPGFPMYFCWMIAHLEHNPWIDRIIDPRYVWLVDK